MKCEKVVLEPIISWRELNGIVYLSIVFDEFFSESWIDRLGKLIPGKKIILIQDQAKSILLSPDFKNDKPAIYEVAILKDLARGGFDERSLYTKEITDKALSLGLGLLDPVVTCIAREKISQADLAAMGIDSLVFMHKPISDSSGKQSLLSLHQGNHYDACYHDMLAASCCDPDGGWFPGVGFAFLVSKTYL